MIVRSSSRSDHEIGGRDVHGCWVGVWFGHSLPGVVRRGAEVLFESMVCLIVGLALGLQCDRLGIACPVVQPVGDAVGQQFHCQAAFVFVCCLDLGSDRFDGHVLASFRAQFSELDPWIFGVRGQAQRRCPDRRPSR